MFQRIPVASWRIVSLLSGLVWQLSFTSGTLRASRLPLVYLLAPALRFHPVTGTLLDALSPQIEVVRVGLTESWRRGIRVVMRH